MAGSYNHIIDEDGNLASHEYVVDILENGGDVFETIEQMYGMIWFLASRYVSEEYVKEAVEEARENYEMGLKKAEKLNGEG